MWAIRILTGSQAGQIIPLRPGALKIGRGTACEVKIASASVSKEHAQVHVTPDKLIVADLNSRNGTFVNGVRVQRQILKIGDKVALHDIIFDVLDIANMHAIGGGLGPRAHGGGFSNAGDGAIYPHPHSFAGQPYGSAAPQMHGQMHGQINGQMHMGYDAHASAADPAADEAPRFSANSLPDLWRAVVAYVDNVAMPGVYSLAKRTQFRYVLAAFVGAFAFMVTLFSTVPMTSAMKSSMEGESQRRALTIARNLALVNRQAILDGLEVSVNTQMAENEDGVESALVLAAKDGRVIAPASRAGAYSEKPYILRVRKKVRDSEKLNDREYVEQIDSSKIVAAAPIKKFNAEGSGQAVVAYAVIVYDMGAVAFESSETLILLGQTLAIASIFGLILFWFLAKTIEHPILALNAQLDDALREGKDDIYVEFQWPELAALASNINSALSRVAKGSSDASAAAPQVDRDAEALSLVEASPSPAIAVNAIDDQIVAANAAFMGLIAGGEDLRRRPLADISDQALRDHVRALIDRLRADASQPARDQIPFSEGTYSSSGVAVSGGSETAYYFIVLGKMDGG